MYGRVEGFMTEATPYNPINKKGEVRAKIAMKLLTGKDLLHLAAEVFGVGRSFMQLNPFMIWMSGLGNRAIMESVELYYQYKYDYKFDSGKYNQYFGYTPIAYKESLIKLSKTFFKPQY